MKRISLFLLTNAGVLLVLNLALAAFESAAGPRALGLNRTGILVVAAIFGMGGAFVSLAMSKWIALRTTRARVIARPANAVEAWLLDTVRRLARDAGIGMPDVAIYDAPDVNAFATGMKRDQALVAVSAGLMHGMNRDEIEAVLGHEISHVANGDMVTLTLIQGVVNTFVLVLSRVIGQVIDRAVFKTERGYGPGYFVTVIVTQMVLGILASMIVMWFSRWREFRADAGGARLAGRGRMIAALERLQAASRVPQLPSEMASFGISGRIGHGLKRLFMSHPPLEERIAALRAAPP